MRIQIDDGDASRINIELMRKYDSDATPADWALRFAATQTGVFKALSVMSTVQQMEQNTAYMENCRPLSEGKTQMLFECARIIREHGPLHESDYSEYEGLTYHDLPVDALLQMYNSNASQANPGFTADDNYIRQEPLKASITDLHQEWPAEDVFLEEKDTTRPSGLHSMNSSGMPSDSAYYRTFYTAHANLSEFSGSSRS